MYEQITAIKKRRSFSIEFLLIGYRMRNWFRIMKILSDKRSQSFLVSCKLVYLFFVKCVNKRQTCLGKPDVV